MRDPGMVAELLLRHELIASAGDRDEYMPGLAEMINQAFEYVDTMDIGAFDPKKIDPERAHMIRVSDEVNSVLRSVTMAEGVCKSAYPGFDLQESIDGAGIAARRASTDFLSMVEWFSDL